MYTSTGFTGPQIVTSIHKTTTNPRHLFVNGLITNLEPWLLTHEGAREANMKNVPSLIQQSMTLDQLRVGLVHPGSWSATPTRLAPTLS